MTLNGWVQMAVFLGVLLVLAKPLGLYMAGVYEGRFPVLGKIERPLFKLCGIQDEEMDWKHYAAAILIFNALGFIAVYALQRFQGFLPANPQGFTAVTPDSAFNTAVSFATNTNWQSYSGETTMSYLTQMLGLNVQNFLSCATGMVVLVALTRGLARKESGSLGNAWVDLTRSTLFVLLPMSTVLSLALVSQGVVQNFRPYDKIALVQSAHDVDGKNVKTSTVPQGPAASQIAIKQLGTNGGGFFNANSAHPLENPTPLSNFLQVLSILLIPAALCVTFGEMVRDRRQGWVILTAMTVIFVAFLAATYTAEGAGNPRLADLTSINAGNLEGKETRFGVANSALWATATTAASNGSVNAMHDSFSPLGGLFPMLLMQLGEVVFGGAGSGLYGMLMFVIVAVFVAGLMVGRTPEYLGKKIEAYEMKMAALVVLIPCALVLVGTAIAVSNEAGRATVFNPGAHGFSEVLYALSSAANNNGSAFAGLGANNPFYNTLLGLAMFFARYWIIVPILALAGSLARKKLIAPGPGTLPTHTPLFAGFLVGVVLLVGALTFIPALALGPIVEQLQMLKG